MNHISSGELKTLFAVIADTFRDNCAYLCEIDAQMGDGDLGLTMKKGFAAAAETIEAMEEPAIGRQLMQAVHPCQTSPRPRCRGHSMASRQRGRCARGSARRLFSPRRRPVSPIREQSPACLCCARSARLSALDARESHFLMCRCLPVFLCRFVKDIGQ